MLNFFGRVEVAIAAQSFLDGHKTPENILEEGGVQSSGPGFCS